MEGLQNISTYQEFKAATDREVSNQAEGFVRLGYLLRRAEDTDILEESGYKTVTEFAKAEYGLTETYVSRYININRRYSEGGYSDRLEARFKGFGMAKLADMLTLTDEVVEAIPAEATRAQIQEIKREAAKEQETSDLEILAEEREDQEESLLSRALKEYYHTAVEEYQELYEALTEREDTVRLIAEAMAPAGSAVKMMRVAGEGRLMLTLRGRDQNPELLNIRNGGKQAFSWEELCQCLRSLYVDGFSGDAKRDWEAVYLEDFPESTGKTGKKSAPVVGIAKTEKQPSAGKKPEEKSPENREKEKIAPVQEKESPKEEEKAGEVPDAAGGPAPMQEPEEQIQDQTGKEDEEAEETVPPRDKKQQDKLEAGAAGVPEKDSRIPHLKEEAGEQLEKIGTALEKSYYATAKMEAKGLVRILENIIKELEKKEIPGQQKMKDYIGSQ
ncbi:MAG: hypothetical protein HFG70_07700 [Hungatella sp.]|nr:hypothetical protein [Hungatella sp.]